MFVRFSSYKLGGLFVARRANSDGRFMATLKHFLAETWREIIAFLAVSKGEMNRNLDFFYLSLMFSLSTK